MTTTTDDVFFTLMLKVMKIKVVGGFLCLNMIKNLSPQVLNCMNWQVVRNNNRCSKSTKK